jgi:hypothetical protein
VPSVLAKSAGVRAAAGCGSRPLTWTHRCRPFGAEASGGLEPSAHAITRQGAQRQRDRTGAVHAACSRSLKRVDPLPRQRGGRRRCLRRADQLARAAGQACSGHPGGAAAAGFPTSHTGAQSWAHAVGRGRGAGAGVGPTAAGPPPSRTPRTAPATWRTSEPGDGAPARPALCCMSTGSNQRQSDLRHERRPSRRTARRGRPVTWRAVRRGAHATRAVRRA